MKNLSSKLSWLLGAALLVSVSLAAMATDAKPPLDRFSAEDLKKLTAGEPVYRFVEEQKDGETGGHGEAYIIINTPVETCWKLFTEFEKMPEYIPRKTESKVLESKPGYALVYKKFDFYVVDIEYTMVYAIDDKNHRIDFDLDKSKPHDLEESAGYYQFEKIDDKRTLLSYAALKVETGVSVPSFIQGYLTSKDLPGVVVNIKKRMESGGTWKKDD